MTSLLDGPPTPGPGPRGRRGQSCWTWSFEHGQEPGHVVVRELSVAQRQVERAAATATWWAKVLQKNSVWKKSEKITGCVKKFRRFCVKFYSTNNCLFLNLRFLPVVWQRGVRLSVIRGLGSNPTWCARTVASFGVYSVLKYFHLCIDQPWFRSSWRKLRFSDLMFLSRVKGSPFGSGNLWRTL